MNVLITGSNGFIGKNLISKLMVMQNHNIIKYDIESTLEELESYAKITDVIVHLAGVNRPNNIEDFQKGNFGFTSDLLELLKKYNNTCPIILSSSIQAERDNPYGISKKAGEDLLFQYGRGHNVDVMVYRFPNVFGKWCKPNYNSAVATFCHNIAHDLPITVNDPNVEMNLVYIDDVVDELIRAIDGKPNHKNQFCYVEPVHQIKLGDIVTKLESFKNSRKTNLLPDLSDPFTKKLYSTYLSYLPIDSFSYELKSHVDHRGSFTEAFKTLGNGQVSVNISKPGIVKGNHYHHTKNEKFLVVSGTGVIRFRKIDSSEVLEYYVSGEKLEVVDIPPGYTHNIENLGSTDMVTIMWANELFDPTNPDTYFLEV